MVPIMNVMDANTQKLKSPKCISPASRAYMAMEAKSSIYMVLRRENLSMSGPASTGAAIWGRVYRNIYMA